MTWFPPRLLSTARRRTVALAIALLAGTSVGVAVAPAASAGPNCTNLEVTELCSTTTNNTGRDVGTARDFCGPDGNGGPCAGSQFGVLHPGDHTPAHQDWDAFFVPSNCVFRGNVDRAFQADVSFVIFPSANGTWQHVHNDENYQINEITCDQPVDPAVRIRSANSGLCLVARNAAGENPVVQVGCAGFVDQKWQLLGNGGDLVQIFNRNSLKCVATRGFGESPAVATTCGAQWADQLWHFEFDADWGAYRFRNVNSGLCLVVRGGAAETRAVQSTCGPWADQRWTTGLLSDPVHPGRPGGPGWTRGQGRAGG